LQGPKKLTATAAELYPHLPTGTLCWVLTDGKVGDEVQCLGIAEALGLVPERRLIAPRRVYALAMPYGPIDPREAPDRPGSPLRPPFPDIAIAAGRRTVPYLRSLKRLSGGKTFTVFVKDPYWSRAAMDLIVVPEHDRLAGPNIVTALTPANRLSEAGFAAARAAPDPRIARLPPPRIGLILGGDSQHHRFERTDIAAVAAIARQIAESGHSLMVTPSRRTPPLLTEALTAAFAELPRAARENIFLWAGEAPNPYPAILAHADALVVTGDSVNMVGEAVATGVPVHVYEPSGGHRKIAVYLDRLEALGAIRRWRGQLESWSYAPINATAEIAAEIGRRYQAFQQRRT
jgi:mitochondrial fission protein ELM1